MQTVLIGDNLHEYQNQFSGENKKNIILPSAEFFTQKVVKVIQLF